MQLDSLTPRGAPYLQHQTDTAERVGFATHSRVLETPDECVVDYLFGKGKQVFVAEVKSRELELRNHILGRRLYDPKKERYYDSYMITHSKVTEGNKVAHLLRAPYYLFVKLIHSDCIVYWELSNPEVQSQIKTADTQTQRSVNGGTKVDANAFIPLNTMKVLSESQW